MQTQTVVSILLFGFEFLWISLYLLIFDCETRFVIQKLDIIFWVRFCSTLQTMSDDFYLSRSFRSLVCLSVTGSFCQKQYDRLVKSFVYSGIVVLEFVVEILGYLVSGKLTLIIHTFLCELCMSQNVSYSCWMFRLEPTYICNT